MRSTSYILVLLGAVSAPTLTPANASTHIYRYDLPTPSCFVDQFKDEIPPGASLAGRSWRVETDALGRPSRWESLRNGKPVYVYTARFTGKATRMAGWDTFRQGKPAGSYRCLSDASGVLQRFEIIDASGNLTEYDLFSPVYSPALGKEVWTGYTPQGKPTLHDTGNTGEIESQKYLNAKSHQLQRVEKFTYDENGDRIRGDIFDAKGIPYGRIDYAAGLENRRVYDRPDRTVETYQYSYDGDRQLADATLSVNGKFICKLVYTTGPDGSTSKTEARAPDGTLWAVYPGRTVEEVTSDGRDPSNSTGTFYRRGKWR
jgi:hypothetical protein